MQRLPTTKHRLNAFTAHSRATPKLFYVNGYSGFVTIFHVSLTCLETFGGDEQSYQRSTSLVLFNEHSFFCLCVCVELSFYEREKKSFAKPHIQ